MRAEIVSDLDLMLDRPLRRPPELAGAQRLFFVRQLHLSAHTHEKPRWCGPMREGRHVRCHGRTYSRCGEYSDQSCSWVSTWKWCNMRWKIGANTKPVAMISKRPEKIAYDPAKIFPAVVFSSPIGPMPARIIAALTYASASDIPSNTE